MSRPRLAPVAHVLLGIVATLAFAEGLLRLLPVQDGVFAGEADPRWPVQHWAPDRDYTWSSGWHFANRVEGRINGRGYVAPFEYTTGARVVAVLGDSYIESLMNPYGSTLQGRLPALLPGAPTVYNFGIAGSALPDYLGLASLVTRDFEVEKLVVLVGEGDYVEAFQPPPGHFTWGEAPGSAPRLLPDVRRDALRRFVRSLALVRYVRGNLRLTTAALFKSRPSHVVSTCEPETLQPGDTPRIQAYVDRLPAAWGLQPRDVVLLFDDESARQQLYGPSPTTPRERASCPTRDSLALGQLATRARAAGMHVVELAPLFEAAWRQSGRRLDHSPLDWHWNADGHAVAARAVAAALSAD